MTYNGAQIRRERRLLKMSQHDLAAATGVSATTIGRIERGDVSDSPNIETLVGYLNLNRDTDTPAGERPPRPLQQFEMWELLSEIALRFTELQSQKPQPQLPTEDLRLPASKSPTARRARAQVDRDAGTRGQQA